MTTATLTQAKPTTTRWSIAAIGAIAVAVRRFLTTAPPRSRYLDDAVMAREIHRL